VYMNLARWCFRHRRLVALTWVVTIVLAGVGVGVAGSDFGGDPEAPESESRTGFEVLEERFGGLGAGNQGTIVFQAEQGVADPQVQAAVQELFAYAEDQDGITVTSPYAPEAFGQIAQEGDLAGQVAFARVEISEDVTFAESGELGAELAARAAELEEQVPGLQVEIGGEILAEFEPPESELIGLAFAIVVLIVSFGSVLAMGLPIAVAVAGVGLGLILTNLLSNVTTMPDFALQIGAMIGLGVGIDYALFIVTRFREYLHQGEPPEVAAMAAIDTAGRAVVFAGVTVVVSLLGLLLIGLEFIAGLGVAAATTVAVTMAASTTLLPALLGFAQLKVEVTRWRGLVAAGLVAVALLGVGLGIPALLIGLSLAPVVLVVGSFVPALKRIVPRREQKPIRESGWYRWSHLIQRRPWPFAIGGTVLLVLLALPVLGLRFGFSDEGNFPEDSTTRQAYDLLSEGFGPGFNGPFFVVAPLDSPDQLARFQAVAEAVAADPGVASVTPAFPNDPAQPTAALVRVIPTSAPQDAETEQLIERLRDEVIPAAAGDQLDVSVTGFVAVSVDFSDYLAGRSLVFFGVVLGVSFVLLMMVFRSLLVPLKAVILNMLSIAGAYGIVVAVFQWGWLGGLTGIEPAPIEPFIPMMMFAIVFGLSMDYEVFLLSRIKEEYEKTGDAQNSVADGLAATARVISAAAAIMVVVFGSFLLEDGRIVKVFGTGLGMAVLLDATLVRMLLVPATMELLGERNWWLPRWLDRLLPELHVEGAPDHREQLARARADHVPAPAGGDEPDATREPVGVS
jgi:putative drug exporter of the RND superfamily